MRKERENKLFEEALAKSRLSLLGGSNILPMNSPVKKKPTSSNKKVDPSL